MKSELDVKELLGALELASPALSRKDFYPILTNFCFKKDRVLAYNDRNAIVVTIDTDLECCLPGALLMKLLASLSSKTALFTFGENEVNITSGRSKLKLPYLPIKDFEFDYPAGGGTADPELHEAVLATFSIDADFIKGIRMCLVSSGNDPTHPAQMGITLESNGKFGTLFSTDNFSISRYDLAAFKDQLPGGAPVILPTFFCQQLLELEKSFPEEEILVHLIDGAVMAEFGDKVYLFSKLVVDTSPMDFEKMIQKYVSDNDLERVVKFPDTFKEAVSRSMILLQNEQDKAAKISCDGQEVTLYTRTSNGTARDQMNFAGSLPQKEMSIDIELLSRVIDLAPRLYLTDDVLVLSDGDGFTHLISRLNDTTK